MNRRNFSVAAGLAPVLGLIPQPVIAGKDAAETNHTAFIFDPVFLQHHIAPGHPESPQRLLACHKLVSARFTGAELYQPRLQAKDDKWLLAVHTREHVTAIRDKSPLAHKVASTAVHAALSAIDLVASGRCRNAFCASRPPGHHARNTGREEGFCYYNQAAVAARYAQQAHGFKKILIVDWDYHHGNGTESAFYHDPDVLFFSTHDFHAYPGTGDPERKGEGEGAGLNINVHLPCGTTNREILEAFQNRLIPAAHRFRPDLLVVSAGFDSRKNDPLGCFAVDNEGFAGLTDIVKLIAEKHCGGRIVSILEGGYNPLGTASAVLAHVDALRTSVRTVTGDPGT